MKELLAPFLILFSFVSCSLINDIAKKEKLGYEAAKDKVYNLSLAEVKKGNLKYFNSWRSSNHQTIKKDFDEGFVYKGKYFQKYEPGLMAIFNSLSQNDRSRLSRYFTEADYFVLEDTNKNYKLVFDGQIYEANLIAPNKVKIQVHTFRKLVYGRPSLSKNFANFLKGKGMLSLIRSGPIILDQSRKFATRDLSAEAGIFKVLDPKGYDKATKL